MTIRLTRPGVCEVFVNLYVQVELKLLEPTGIHWQIDHGRISGLEHRRFGVHLLYTLSLVIGGCEDTS